MHHQAATLQAKAPQAYRRDIDGLRAIAVLAVMAFHFFPSGMKGGFVGVDVFFVISGFLIGGMLLDDFAAARFSLLDFYARRVLRIFPALFLVLAVSLLLGWFVLLPEDYKSLGTHTAGGAGFVSNLVLWAEAGYFDVASERKPLLNLWSLGVEEQFYLFFPIFLWVVWRIRLRPVPCVALLALASLVWSVMVSGRDQAFDFYMPMTRFWELLAGTLLAAWNRRGKAGLSAGGTGRGVLSVVGLGLLVLSLAVVREAQFPGYQALIPVAGSFCLLAAGPLGAINRLLATPPMVWVGLISYPLYLWHWPVLTYLRLITNGSIDHRPGLLLAAVAAVFVLAALTYRLVEMPLRFGAGTRRFKVSLLIVLMFAVGIAGWALHLSDGLPQRWVVKESARIAGSKQAALQDVRGELLPLDLAADHSAFIAAYGALPLPELGYFHNVGGSHTTVVYGDSHGSADYPAIAAYNATIGINTLWFGEAWRFNPGNSSAYVDGLKEAVLRIIAQDTRINKIFVITYHDASGCQTRACLPSQQELDQLQRPGLSIYLVADNPRMNTSDADWMSNDQLQKKLSRQLAIEHPLMPAFLVEESRVPELPGRSRADMMRTYGPYLDDLHSRHGVIFVDGTLDAFCSQQACPFLDEHGMPMYKDSGHLTPRTGAGRLVQKVLKPYLDQ